MIKFLNKIQRAANQFGMFDFATFKIYMFTVGILFGVYFSQFWFDYIVIVWVVAIVACIFTMVRLIQNYIKG